MVHVCINHTMYINRSQSVYSKGSSATSGAASSAAATSAVGGGPLVAATSLVLRPPTHTHAHHALAHNQNAHNAQRDPPYGTANGVRPGPAGEIQFQSFVLQNTDLNIWLSFVYSTPTG